MRTFLKTALVLGTFFAATACSNNAGTTRQQAANTTEQLKREAREAAGDVKKGADTARTQLTAAAQGVKEGLNDKDSSQVDLNSANKSQLMGLPGIDEAQANAIIAGRPYQRSHEVVTKGAVREDEYGKIARHVRVGAAAK